MSKTQVETSVASFKAALPEVMLLPVPTGWEGRVNFNCCPEYLGAGYPRVDMRGVHFLTAAATYIQENAAVMTMDVSGFGAAPTAPHCHETAHEWIGLMYLEGVARLGGGATIDQVRF